MTVTDFNIFKKIFKTYNVKKNLRRRYYFYSGITILKLQLKHYYYTDEKLF